MFDGILRQRGFSQRDFPAVPGEEAAGLGVYGRYGRIVGGYLVDADGNRVPGSRDSYIMRPDGTLELDPRGQARPSWVPHLLGQ